MWLPQERARSPRGEQCARYGYCARPGVQAGTQRLCSRLCLGRALPDGSPRAAAAAPRELGGGSLWMERACGAQIREGNGLWAESQAWRGGGDVKQALSWLSAPQDNLWDPQLPGPRSAAAAGPRPGVGRVVAGLRHVSARSGVGAVGGPMGKSHCNLCRWRAEGQGEGGSKQPDPAERCPRAPRGAASSRPWCHTALCLKAQPPHKRDKQRKISVAGSLFARGAIASVTPALAGRCRKLPAWLSAVGQGRGAGPRGCCLLPALSRFPGTPHLLLSAAARRKRGRM